MRVLVTGASGFIGSHVVRELLDRDADVFALVRPTSSRHRLADLEDRITTLAGDLADEHAVARALDQASPEIALHLAWYAEPGRYLRAERENAASLEQGKRLFRLLLGTGCRRVVVAGTGLESGLHEPGRAVQAPYTAAKAALHAEGERLMSEGLSFACAHVFYVYGPWEDGRRVVPAVIQAVLRGEEIAVTRGDQRRSYLHVADVASAIWAVARSDLTGGVDLCSGDSVTLRDVFEAIGSESRRPDLIKIGARPYGPDDLVSVTGDGSGLEGLGWRPRYELQDGIAHTIDWWAGTTSFADTKQSSP